MCEIFGNAVGFIDEFSKELKFISEINKRRKEEKEHFSNEKDKNKMNLFCFKTKNNNKKDFFDL